MTYEDRVALARKTYEAENLKSLMLVDEIDNPFWCTYGPAPNNAYFINPNGYVINKQAWFNPEEMRTIISNYQSGHP